MASAADRMSAARIVVFFFFPERVPFWLARSEDLVGIEREKEKPTIVRSPILAGEKGEKGGKGCFF